MSNYNVTKIKASGLPTIYPTGYTDKMYTYYESVPIGIHEQVYVTKERYATINDPQFKERTIQAVLYRKYKITIPGNNSQLLEYYKHTEYLTILTKDGQTHRAKVLDFAREKVEGTEMVNYTFEYADINPGNYSDQKDPAVNFLSYDTLSDEFEDDQLLSFQLFSTVTIDAEFTDLSDQTFVYTKLALKESVSEPELKEGELPTGLKEVTRGTIARQAIAQFYLSRTEANLIRKYSDLCDTWLLYSVSFGVYYLAVERPKVEIKEVDGANEIFECTVKLKYQNTDHYPLNT